MADGNVSAAPAVEAVGHGAPHSTVAEAGECYVTRCAFSTRLDERCAADHESTTATASVFDEQRDGDDRPAPHPAAVRALLHPITLEQAAAQHRVPPSRRMQHRLDAPQLALLRRCLSAPPFECDAQALRLCREGAVKGVALYQAADNPHHISLITTEHLRAGEVIGCAVGCLRLLSCFDDPLLPLSSLLRVFFYTVEAAQLHEEYERCGGRDLLLEMQTCCNELRFVRALCPRCEADGGGCEEHADGKADLSVANVCTSLFASGAANAEERIIVHPAFALPFLVLVVVCPTAPGTEVVVRWSDEYLVRYAQHALTLQGAEGWRLHREIGLAQRMIREADGLPHPTSALPPPPPGDFHHVSVTTASAFARSGCVQVDAVLWDEVDPHKKAEVQRLFKARIDKRLLRAAEETANGSGRRRNSKQRKSELAVLAPTSEEVDRLSVSEVLSCLHPVRFYAPPDRPAFAAVYSRSLDAGRMVALYTGSCQVEDAVQATDTELYSWEIAREHVQLPFSLVIQADRVGGPARFVNDAVFRRGGDACTNCAAETIMNAAAHLPDVLLRTTKRVQAGDEAICSYGLSQRIPRQLCTPCSARAHRPPYSERSSVCEEQSTGDSSTRIWPSVSALTHGSPLRGTRPPLTHSLTPSIHLARVLTVWEEFHGRARALLAACDEALAQRGLARPSSSSAPFDRRSLWDETQVVYNKRSAEAVPPPAPGMQPRRS